MYVICIEKKRKNQHFKKKLLNHPATERIYCHSSHTQGKDFGASNTFPHQYEGLFEHFNSKPANFRYGHQKTNTSNKRELSRHPVFSKWINGPLEIIISIIIIFL